MFKRDAMQNRNSSLAGVDTGVFLVLWKGTMEMQWVLKGCKRCKPVGQMLNTL